MLVHALLWSYIRLLYIQTVFKKVVTPTHHMIRERALAFQLTTLSLAQAHKIACNAKPFIRLEVYCDSVCIAYLLQNLSVWLCVCHVLQVLG